MSLDPAKVPPYVVPLLPIAEKWGIGDDIERTQLVEAATQSDLELLATCLDNVDEEAVFGWLAGPESYLSPPTDEYVAVTNLTMAIDLAVLRLKRQAAQDHGS